MTKTAIQFTILYIVLALAQAIVFNNVCLFGAAVPFVFIYVIIRLPMTLAVNWVLTIGFTLGFIVDIFSDTQGMNSLACTLLAMARRPILHLYFPREDELTMPEPSIRSLGPEIYGRYLFTMVLFYCTAIFLIEAFSLFDPLRLMLRVICSTFLTFLLLLGLDSVISRGS